MEENRFDKLRVKSEYQRLCQPISPEVYAALEANMINSTESITIKVWSTVVLCDFETYEICLMHNLPYRIERINPYNSEEAMMWVCRHQICRNDLTESMRHYLIGKMAILEKMLGLHDIALRRGTGKTRANLQKSEPKYYDTVGKIRERLGVRFNVNPMTIGKYEQYAKGIDIIYDIVPDFATQILTEAIKLSQMRISEISKMKESEIRLVAEDTALLFYDRMHSESRQQNNDTIPSMGLIKNIPEYDPDAEIASLTLTIPSWISSMNRVKLAADRVKASNNAKEKLCVELIQLSKKTFELLSHFEEEV